VVEWRDISGFLLQNLKYINVGLLLLLLLAVPAGSLVEYKYARTSASIEPRNPSPNHPDSHSLVISRPSTSEINFINEVPSAESFQWLTSRPSNIDSIPSGVQITGSTSLYHYDYIHLQSLDSLNFTGHLSILEGEVSVLARIGLPHDYINTEYILHSGEEIDFEVYLDREQISNLTRDWLQECSFGIHLDLNTTSVVNLTDVKAIGKTYEPLSSIDIDLLDAYSESVSANPYAVGGVQSEIEISSNTVPQNSSSLVVFKPNLTVFLPADNYSISAHWETTSNQPFYAQNLTLELDRAFQMYIYLNVVRLYIESNVVFQQQRAWVSIHSHYPWFSNADFFHSVNTSFLYIPFIYNSDSVEATVRFRTRIHFSSSNNHMDLSISHTFDSSHDWILRISFPMVSAFGLNLFFTQFVALMIIPILCSLLLIQLSEFLKRNSIRRVATSDLFLPILLLGVSAILPWLNWSYSFVSDGVFFEHHTELLAPLASFLFHGTDASNVVFPTPVGDYSEWDTGVQTGFLVYGSIILFWIPLIYLVANIVSDTSYKNRLRHLGVLILPGIYTPFVYFGFSYFSLVSNFQISIGFVFAAVSPLVYLSVVAIKLLFRARQRNL